MPIVNVKLVQNAFDANQMQTLQHKRALFPMTWGHRPF